MLVRPPKHVGLGKAKPGLSAFWVRQNGLHSWAGGRGGPGTLEGKPGLLRQQTIQVSGDLASPPNPGTWGRMCPPGQRVLGGAVSPQLSTSFCLWFVGRPAAWGTQDNPAGWVSGVLPGPGVVRRAGEGVQGTGAVAPGRLHQARWVVSGLFLHHAALPRMCWGWPMGFLNCQNRHPDLHHSHQNEHCILWCCFCSTLANSSAEKRRAQEACITRPRNCNSSQN